MSPRLTFDLFKSMASRDIASYEWGLSVILLSTILLFVIWYYIARTTGGTGIVVCRPRPFVATRTSLCLYSGVPQLCLHFFPPTVPPPSVYQILISKNHARSSKTFVVSEIKHRPAVANLSGITTRKIRNLKFYAPLRSVKKINTSIK